MQTDRELLELAAKAAGYEGVITEYQNGYCEMGLTNHFKPDGSNVWTPLHNDSDALRLAVKLAINIDKAKNDLFISGADWGDMYAFTRRAIVLAAAEIGKAMP